MKYKIVLPEVAGVDSDWKRHLVIMIKADLELDIKLPAAHRVFEYDVQDGYELRVSVKHPDDKWPDSVAITSGNSDGGVYKNFEIVPHHGIVDFIKEVEEVFDEIPGYDDHFDVDTKDD